MGFIGREELSSNAKNMKNTGRSIPSRLLNETNPTEPPVVPAGPADRSVCLLNELSEEKRKIVVATSITACGERSTKIITRRELAKSTAE